MKFCNSQSYNKPDNLDHCYRIIGTRAYFQNDNDVCYCEFTLSEIRKMQISAVFKNMKTGNVSDWECCDKEGLFSKFKETKLRYLRMSSADRESVAMFRSLAKLKENELSNSDVNWMKESELSNFIKWLDDEGHWEKVIRKEKYLV